MVCKRLWHKNELLGTKSAGKRWERARLASFILTGPEAQPAPSRGVISASWRGAGSCTLPNSHACLQAGTRALRQSGPHQGLYWGEGRKEAGLGAPAPDRQVLVCISPPGLWASVDRRQLNLFGPWSTKDARKMFVLFHWGYISGLAAAEFVCVILHKLFDLRWQKQHTQGFLLRDCHCEQVGPAQGDPSQFLSVLWTIL